jgi:hypothetical protein
MKLRTLVLIALGIAVGYWLSSKRHQDDPNVVVGPRDDARTGSPAGRFVSGQAHRLADQATARSLDAIRRARGAIRERIGEQQTDDALWN